MLFITIYICINTVDVSIKTVFIKNNKKIQILLFPTQLFM